MKTSLLTTSDHTLLMAPFVVEAGDCYVPGDIDDGMHADGMGDT